MSSQLLANSDDTSSGTYQRNHRTAVLALAEVETRRLLRHPLVWAGLALSAAFSWSVLRDLLPVFPTDLARLAGTAAPLAVSVLLAANLGTLRPSAHGADDVYGTVPVGPHSRTIAMLAASAASGALGIAYAFAGVVYLKAAGGTGSPHIADALAIPLLVATAGTLGVAVARWVPRSFAGPAAAILFVGTQFWLGSGSGRRPRLALPSDWGPGLSVPIELLHRDPGLHLVYVAGVAVTISSVGLLRHGLSRARVGAALAGLAIVVATAPALLAPLPPAAAERLLATATDGDALTECVEHEHVEYCTPPLYHGWIDRWHQTVAGVHRAIPDDERPERFRVRMATEVPASSLRPLLPDGLLDQAAELTVGTTDSGAAFRSGPEEVLVDRQQHRGLRGEQEALGLAVAAASDAFDLGGMAPADGSGQENEGEGQGAEADGAALARCTPAGQAREIVALYLATVHNASAQAALRREIDQRPYQLLVFDEDVVIDDDLFFDRETFDASQAARWSRSGATLALRLLDEPPDLVLPRLWESWSRWTDPTTARDEFVAAFELDPVPSAEQLAREADIDPARLGDVGREDFPACT